MKFPKLALVAAIGFASVTGSSFSRAETLISEEEAKLPAAVEVSQRAITRGPTVHMINSSEVKSPFDLQLRFEAHGGAAIEPGSIKVTYLKAPPVDITNRIKPFVSADGITFVNAEAPNGEHDIRVDVKDSEGRATSTKFTLDVK